MSANEREYEQLTIEDLVDEACRICDEVERLNRQVEIINQVIAGKLIREQDTRLSLRRRVE